MDRYRRPVARRGVPVTIASRGLGRRGRLGGGRGGRSQMPAWPGDAWRRRAPTAPLTAAPTATERDRGGDGVGVAVTFGIAVGFGTVTVNDRIAWVAGRHRAPAHASALNRCDPLPFGVGAEGTLRIERHVFGSIGSFPPIALPSQKNCAVVKLQAVSPVGYVAVKPALARPLPGLTLRVGVGWTV